MRALRLQRLIGRVVHDPDGRSLGRIEELRAEARDGELLITAYLVGAASMIERFSVVDIARTALSWFGRDSAPGYVVPWQHMDLSDPSRPRCRVPASALERLQPG